MTTDFRGAIFDVDGVLVDSPHERAWRDALKELMETEWSEIRPETSYSPERFTPHVYQHVMSGKPRYSGAQAALEYFGVPDAERRSRTYGDRKQSMVIELIEAGEFTAYPDALRFIIAVKDAGIRVAAASSSKNAGLFLRKIRLDTFAEENDLESEHVTPGLTLQEFFDADISGRDFAQGKPHSEIFLTGAKELGVPPEECFVVEDAVSGIQAAKAGGMAALGLSRADDEDLLAAAEPDVLVTSLDDIDLDALAQGRLAQRDARSNSAAASVSASSLCLGPRRCPTALGALRTGHQMTRSATRCRLRDSGGEIGPARRPRFVSKQ